VIKARKVARWVVGLAALALASLYLRRMPFGEMVGSLRGAEPASLLFAALVYLGPNTAARVWRWASLLAVVPRRGVAPGGFQLARILFAAWLAKRIRAS
jgi:hypothetical protein